MQTTKPKESAKKKKISRLRKIVTGEFMVDESFTSTYPYIGFLIVLIALVIITHQRGERKEDQIRKKQAEYKEGLSRLKQNNNFIPYEQTQELLKMVEEQGFTKSDRHLYRVEIKSEN